MRRFLDRALEHLPSLWAAARRWTRDEAQAEDLVQDTLVRAMEKRQQLREPERLRGWLLTVQRSIHLNRVQTLRARFEVLDGGRQRTEPTGDLEAEIVDATLGEELATALDALQPEWREALWLREVDGLTYKEIAVVQGCPVGTVRSRLARAREALSSALQGGGHGRLQRRVE